MMNDQQVLFASVRGHSTEIKVIPFYKHFAHLFVDDHLYKFISVRHNPPIKCGLGCGLTMKMLHRLTDRTIKTTLPGNLTTVAGFT
jgi:hypothetical protein